tara:strand:- start:1986 stop:2756 length:771 start_codon:yes stop_codon:yes gene_type:complete
MNIVLIPSKSRAKKTFLINQLVENNLKFYYFVEPSELTEYYKILPKKNVINILKNNQGIGYVRNFILNYAQTNNIKKYWTLDDDLTNFYHREEKKMVKNDINVLKKVEKQFKDSDYGIYGLEYQQFAWSANKEKVENSYMDCCVCIDAEKAYKKNIKYRPRLNLKEDRDFAMQFIKNGYNNARSTLYAFSCPKNGSNEGGLSKEYKENNGEKEKRAVERMIEEWGVDICRKIIKKDGRVDVKIFWKKINQKQQNLF